MTRMSKLYMPQEPLFKKNVGNSEMSCLRVDLRVGSEEDGTVVRYTGSPEPGHRTGRESGSQSG